MTTRSDVTLLPISSKLIIHGHAYSFTSSLLDCYTCIELIIYRCLDEYYGVNTFCV